MILPKILCDDTEETISDSGISWNELRNSAILITGATGMIGFALVRALSAVNKKYGLGVKILATGRDTKKAKPLVHEYGAEFFPHDIREPLAVVGRVDYIFHCAAVTKSSEMAENPVGVSETSLKGTMNMLSLAREKRTKSMVYLSSMEIYGITDPAMPFVTEDDLGTIDIKSPRNCYPESKRMCEYLCNAYFAQHSVPVKTARLAQTFGAGAAKDDPRVFAQFARSAVAGENIVLHTEGESRGNYCYLSDAVRGLFFLLLKGENGEAYNIANPGASVTIREMAELLAHEVCGGEVSIIVDLTTDIEKRGYAPDVNRRLSTEKIEKLGWKTKYGLAEMYTRMIADWRECEE
jgi:nucleoside-diphosphate-sugar epimerase